jgi:hypothetical protein
MVCINYLLINVVFDELVIVKIIQQFSADVMISGTLFYFIFCVCVCKVNL